MKAISIIECSYMHLKILGGGGGVRVESRRDFFGGEHPPHPPLNKTLSIAIIN